ncbi:AAA family ATPase [Pseudomonas salomonii]|uniref:AAA family ATPase n=1 Tax=Pseudomonas salomonii TaxID=191391 RepID=A0ABS9GI13_9PSED|nr:AAA family ATPase [Pseudomonas salomonii]MCF5545393.1 AAA family ATPase [Pseudomonas salomonii]
MIAYAFLGGFVVLERIERIQGIGLLHDVNGRPLRLCKAQLIYADNGRGKSTLASILRSAATGDPSLITERKTIDASLAPLVDLTFGSGHKVSFSNGTWSEKRQELLVFDADFVEKNVHSGGVVTPGQRKNLLQFALGSSAVKARETEEITTKLAAAASAEVNQITAQLAGFHQGMLLPAFQKLSADPNAATKILDLQKRIQIANNIGNILTRPLPVQVSLPNLDIESLFKILNTTLNDIQEDAESVIQKHLQHISKPDIEKWISDGQKFDDGKNCPYCAQKTSDITLIKAYRTHFNKAYEELKQQVALLDRGIQIRASDSVIDTFDIGFSKALTTIATWTPEIITPPCTFESLKSKKIIGELRGILLELAATKISKPLESIGSNTEKSKVHELWNEILDLMQQANQKIQNSTQQIEKYRTSLASENATLMGQQIIALQLGTVRHSTAVIALLTSLATAKQSATVAEAKKKAARTQLNEQMASVLATFQKSINSLLDKFGATFRIEKMDSNFRGGSARSEYGLRLRGMSISLDGTPKFSTVLSEGDKRTLAFAFFVATVSADPNLLQKIVVIDDPMCSLDVNRKNQTKAILKSIHDKSEQLILLAHDPYFIRDMRDELSNKGAQTLQALQLRYAANGYSDLDKFDVDKECESPFYRHHRVLMELCAGAPHDSRSTAKAIRPFLEGYLHRRFPGLLPKDSMFGQVLTHIRNSTAPSPLTYAKTLIDELQEINSYAGQFHHDTNPDCDTVQITSSELLTYGERALKLVYSGTVEPV